MGVYNWIIREGGINWSLISAGNAWDIAIQNKTMKNIKKQLKIIAPSQLFRKWIQGQSWYPILFPIEIMFGLRNTS